MDHHNYMDMNSQRKQQIGFTLIELAAVIIVSGVLVVALAYNFPGFKPNVKAQARQMVRDIRYTQHYAMTHYVHAGIDFVASGAQDASYTMRDYSNGDTQLTDVPSSYVNLTDLGFSLEIPLFPNNADFVGTGRIAFDSMGAPLQYRSVEADYVPLTDNDRLNLCTHGECVEVRINVGTGYAQIIEIT
jgi:prepilin-type N-terminal cleavage/methylation domain-containing protein